MLGFVVVALLVGILVGGWYLTKEGKLEINIDVKIEKDK